MIHVESSRINNINFLTHPTLFVQVNFRHVESTAGGTIQPTLKAQISYIL